MPSSNNPPDKCGLCREEKTTTTVSVRNEETGAVKEVDLCEDCRELGRRHRQGEDVDWSEVLPS